MLAKPETGSAQPREILQNSAEPCSHLLLSTEDGLARTLKGGGGLPIPQPSARNSPKGKKNHNINSTLPGKWPQSGRQLLIKRGIFFSSFSFFSFPLPFTTRRATNSLAGGPGSPTERYQDNNLGDDSRAPMFRCRAG